MRRPIDRLTRGRIPNKPGVVAPTVFAINNPANLANVVTGVPITISGTSPGVAAVSVTGNAVAIGSSPVVGNSWSVPWTPGALGAVALVATDGALSSNISVNVIAAVAFAFTNPANLASVTAGVSITVSGTSPSATAVSVTANGVPIGSSPVVGNAWSFSWTPTIAGATTLAATDGTLNTNISITITAAIAFAFTNPADLASVPTGSPITVSGTSPSAAAVSVTANAVAIGGSPVAANAWSFPWTPTVAGATALAATDGTLTANISVTVTAASGYNPAVDASMRGWFDMLDAAAFVQSAGVMVSIRNKFNSEDWNAASTNFPTFNATGLNGRPCMQFAAASNQSIGRIESAVCGVFSPASPNWTAIFIMANELADIGSRIYFCASQSTSTRSVALGQHSTGAGIHTNTRIDNASVNTSVTATPPPLTTPHSLIWVVSGGVATIYVNGVAGVVTGAPGLGAATLDRPSFGGRWDSLFDSPWGGSHSEAIFCNVAKTAPEAAAIHAYAAAKWGLPP